MRKLKLYGTLIGIVGLMAVIRRIPAPQPGQLDGVIKSVILICGIPLLLVILLALFVAGVLALRWWRHSSAMMRIEERAAEARIPVIDRSDVLGSLVVTDQKMVELERGTVRSLQGELETMIPELNLAEQRRSLIASGRGWPKAAALEPPSAVVGPDLPKQVSLLSILSTPDVADLVLGVGENGRIVKADMSKMVHVAVGGSSGWGKSVFLRALGFQLALSQTPVDLVAVDLEATTLAPLANCKRLLYPIADTEQEALGVFTALLDEMGRRKELYNAYPGVDSLRAYNAESDVRLNPVICLVDEATALLSSKGVESALRTLCLRARKYGLWLVLAGQDWKGTSLDTAIRNQLSSRVQFKTMGSHQSRVLLQQAGAEKLDTVGRALTILPGQSMFPMQAPFISREDIERGVGNGGPQGAIPILASPAAGNGGDVARIKELAAEGWGPSSIAREVFGSPGGSAYYKVKDVLDELNG